VELHRAGPPLPSTPLRSCVAVGSELYALRLAGEEVALVAGGRRAAALVSDGEGPGRDAPRHGAGGVKGRVEGEAAEARAPVRSGRCRRSLMPRGEVGARQLPPETGSTTPRANAGYRQPPPPDTLAGLVGRPPLAPVWGARRTSRPLGQAHRGAAPAWRPRSAVAWWVI
jgi:hypothetical protein